MPSSFEVEELREQISTLLEVVQAWLRDTSLDIDTYEVLQDAEDDLMALRDDLSFALEKEEEESE